MDEFNPIALALPAENTRGNAINSSAQLADTFDTFLTLLTEQLQNQDPLNPMDSQQFVSQLVEFTSVEQQIAQNDSLETLLALQSATAVSSAIDYVGRDVTVSTDRAALNNSQAEWTYGLDREASSTRLIISNSSGKIVRTMDGETGAGPQTASWDGKDDAGNQMPDGIYQLEVFAKDSNDVPIDVPVRVEGRVTGVDMSGGEYVVELGNLRVSAFNVIAVRESNTPS